MPASQCQHAWAPRALVPAAQLGYVSSPLDVPQSPRRRGAAARRNAGWQLAGACAARLVSQPPCHRCDGVQSMRCASEEYGRHRRTGSVGRALAALPRLSSRIRTEGRESYFWMPHLRFRQNWGRQLLPSSLSLVDICRAQRGASRLGAPLPRPRQSVGRAQAPATGVETSRASAPQMRLSRHPAEHGPSTLCMCRVTCTHTVARLNPGLISSEP